MGLVFALVGVGMTLVTDNGMWDAAGTLMIGLLLVCVAFVLGRETRAMLLGEAAVDEDIAKIRESLARAGYPDVIHLRTMHLGPDDVLVTAKVAAQPHETLAEISARTDGAEELIRAAVPAARLIFIEPDVRHRDAPADASSREGGTRH